MLEKSVKICQKKKSFLFLKIIKFQKKIASVIHVTNICFIRVFKEP